MDVILGFGNTNILFLHSYSLMAAWYPLSLKPACVSCRRGLSMTVCSAFAQQTLLANYRNFKMLWQVPHTSDLLLVLFVSEKQANIRGVDVHCCYTCCFSSLTCSAELGPLCVCIALLHTLKTERRRRRRRRSTRLWIDW